MSRRATQHLSTLRQMGAGEKRDDVARHVYRLFPVTGKRTTDKVAALLRRYPK